MIKSLLNFYDIASSQAINYEKSNLYGLNLSPQLLRLDSQVTTMSIDNLPIPYLGLPLFQGGKVKDF